MEDVAAKLLGVIRGERTADAVLADVPEGDAATRALVAEVARLVATRVRQRERDWLAARGVLAGGVAAELARPLAHLRQVLALAVEALDRHVGTAKGPEPLSWTQVGWVREKVAEAFLDLGRLARLAGDLAAVTSATAPGDGLAAGRPMEVNDVVERAVVLARHTFPPDGDVFVDLGDPPAARGDGARVAQAIAHLLVQAAGTTTNGPLVVRTRGRDGGALVTITHPRAHVGVDPPVLELVRDSLAADGGELVFAEGDETTTAEIRLAAAS